MAHATPESPMHLELFLLGRPEIRRNGQPLHGQPPVKGQALLYYLAVTRNTLTREALAGLFWGDMGEEMARGNLRLTLSRLRQAIGPYLLADRRSVSCDFDLPIWVDVHAFETSLSASGQADSAELRATLNLYRGEFLHDFPVSDAPDFDMWVLSERERLHRMVMNGLHRLLQLERDAGRYAEAINACRRLVSLEPWDEEAHRQLMWLLSVTGQRSAALAQYAACCRILEQELGVPPAAETAALYAAIKKESHPAAFPQAPGAPEMSQPVDAPSPVDALDGISTPGSQLFVGRARELATLRAVLRETTAGNGRPLFIVGGAGRGKSTLVREFVRTAQTESPELLVATGRCSARDGIGDPYLPFREILHQLTGDVRSTGGGGALERVQASALARGAAVTIPILVEEAPDLIGSYVTPQQLLDRAKTLADPAVPWLQTLARRAGAHQAVPLEQPRLFAHFASFFAGVAQRRPLVLVLEDLQWADASSISLFFHLAQMLAATRILLIGTYRPDEVLAARTREQHSLAGLLDEFKRLQGQIWIDLAQQSPAEERAFVDAYVDAEPNRLDEDFRSRLLRHTQGHALFTLEVLRELQTRGDLVKDDHGRWCVGRTIDWHLLPAKVEGVIEQRVRAVDKELRTYLTIAAVEGETFTAEVLAKVLGEEVRVVVRRLSQSLDQEHRLIQFQSLEQVGEQRLSRFRFRHQLFQHYLYQSLSAAERTYAHEDIGAALEVLYGPRAPEYAGALAEHFRAAGSTPKALRYLTLAAQQASAQTANLEAAAYARAGLELLDAIPPGVERMKLELLLQIVRGRSAMYTHGYGAPDTEAGFVRAKQLCEQMGRIPQIFPVMYGLWAVYMLRGEFEAACQQSLNVITLGAEQGNLSAEMLGHGMMGLPLVWMGALAEARAHLETLDAWYAPAQDVESSAIYGQAALLSRLASLPMLLCMLGYADQARSKSTRILQMSDAVADPISRAFVLAMSAIAYQLLDDLETTAVMAEAIVEHCQKQVIPLWLAYGLTLRGWVSAMRGDASGTSLMRSQINLLLGRQELSGTPWLLALLAEALACTGELDGGLHTADEGLALASAIGDKNNQIHLQLVRADILIEMSRSGASTTASLAQAAAEALLSTVEMARRSGHKLGHLRASIRLYRIWQGYDKGAHAAEMLGAIYGTFVEGFDTADLRTAKAILQAHTGA